MDLIRNSWISDKKCVELADEKCSKDTLPGGFIKHADCSYMGI
jgi:hypothetical protein